MTKKPEILFNAYLKLSPAERAELVKAMNEYIEGGTEKKASIMQENFANVTKMDIGPMGGSCPYCGK